MLYQCVARIQPVAPWFLQSFWLATHIHAAVWLPKSCNQCVQLGTVGEHEVESAAAVGLRCMQCAHITDDIFFFQKDSALAHNVRQCTVFLKEKNVICDVFDSVKYWLRSQGIPLILSIDFHSRLDEKQLPSFTQRATDTVTDLVNIERVGYRQQDAMIPFYVGFNCLMHTIDHFGNEG